MKINILTTGGTIEGLEYSSIENAPKETPKKIEHFLQALSVSFDFSIEKVFSKDSRFITDVDRRTLADKIRESEEDKILVTHGTLTMVETAKFLGALDLKKTIVIVGSFIPGTEVNSDAPFNLGYAISILQNIAPGVYIAMHGKVFPWNNVIKNKQKNRFEESV